jgi:hypothetical protein
MPQFHSKLSTVIVGVGVTVIVTGLTPKLVMSMMDLAALHAVATVTQILILLPLILDTKKHTVLLLVT